MALCGSLWLSACVLCSDSTPLFPHSLLSHFVSVGAARAATAVGRLDLPDNKERPNGADDSPVENRGARGAKSAFQRRCAGRQHSWLAVSPGNFSLPASLSPSLCLPLSCCVCSLACSLLSPVCFSLTAAIRREWPLGTTRQLSRSVHSFANSRYHSHSLIGYRMFG